jgi:homotetrameric cytidine deaminase
MATPGDADPPFVVKYVMDFTQTAFDVARAMKEKAYAPYSKFHVGAAVKAAGDATIYGGCNIENASFGAGVCGERVAVFNAVAARGKAGLEFMVLVTDAKPAAVPCAICLQVLAEFCPPEFKIHLATMDGIERTVELRDLLPEPFTL